MYPLNILPMGYFCPNFQPSWVTVFNRRLHFKEPADVCSLLVLAIHPAGLYLSPWDRNQPAYGDSPKYNEYYTEFRLFPPEAR